MKRLRTGTAGLAPGVEEGVVVVVGGADAMVEVVVVVATVLLLSAEASRMYWGASSIDVMAGTAPQRNMDRRGVPVHRYVTQAGFWDDSLAREGPGARWVSLSLSRSPRVDGRGGRRSGGGKGRTTHQQPVRESVSPQSPLVQAV